MISPQPTTEFSLAEHTEQKKRLLELCQDAELAISKIRLDNPVTPILQKLLTTKVETRTIAIANCEVELSSGQAQKMLQAEFERRVAALKEGLRKLELITKILADEADVEYLIRRADAVDAAHSAWQARYGIDLPPAKREDPNA